MVVMFPWQGRQPRPGEMMYRHGLIASVEPSSTVLGKCVCSDPTMCGIDGPPENFFLIETATAHLRKGAA